MSWPCKTGLVRTPAPSATLKLQLPTATHSAVDSMHSDSANAAVAMSRQPMAATADSTLLWVHMIGMVAEQFVARHPTSVAVCTDLYQTHGTQRAFGDFTALATLQVPGRDSTRDRSTPARSQPGSGANAKWTHQ